MREEEHEHNSKARSAARFAVQLPLAETMCSTKQLNAWVPCQERRAANHQKCAAPSACIVILAHRKARSNGSDIRRRIPTPKQLHTATKPLMLSTE